MGKEPDTTRKRKVFKKKSFNKQRGENIKQNIFKSHVLKDINSLEKPPIVQ